MNQCMNKRIDDWVDGWMDGWLSYFFAELLLHWVTSSLRYLFSPRFFSEQPLLLLLSELLWRCRFFWFFLGEIELSWQPHFADLMRLSVFFAILKCKSSSGYSPVHFFSQIEARNWEPTWVTPGATSPEKTQGFAPESVFTHEFTRGNRTFALPNYTWWWCGWHNDGVKQWVCDWHDAEVKMMMWLTWWWCGWHDDVNANHDHRP